MCVMLDLNTVLGQCVAHAVQSANLGARCNEDVDQLVKIHDDRCRYNLLHVLLYVYMKYVCILVYIVQFILYNQ